MPRSKESSDEVRRKVVEAHKAGKGYKTIAKVLDLHRSTVRQIIYKWKAFNTTATRPRSGRPTKLDSILRLMESAAELGGTAAERGDGGAEGADTARISETALEDICGSSEGEGTGRISENEDKTGKYERGCTEEGESARAFDTATSPESANVRVKTEDGNVLLSDRPLRPDDPEVTRTMPPRRRRKEKTKNLKPKQNHSLASPPTPSSSRTTSNPQPETLRPGPAEPQAEDFLCCEICGTYFNTEPELEAHQAQHLLLHECEECGKAVQSASGLKVHKKLKHGLLREHKDNLEEAECE